MLDGYLAEYGARGLADGSVARVGMVLDQWGSWLKRCRPRPRLEAIDAPLIARFIRSRCTFHSKATTYATLSVMRGMGEYLVREGVWEGNPMRWMRGPKVSPYHRLPARLQSSEIQAMWREAAQAPGAYWPRLWITVLSLLYGTGLRRGELARLTVQQFDREAGLLRIDGRKTGCERQVPVPELTYRCLETYLPLRHNEIVRAGAVDESKLLIGQRGRPLSEHAISMGIHRIARRAGVSLRSVHQFRHSCASDLIEAGATLAEVQHILGHQTIGTTLRYTHIADPQRRAAIALHPINDWLGVLEQP
ncbi:MAG: tyrosine-type recombinase/integrase [Usitatibacter sp.]